MGSACVKGQGRGKKGGKTEGPDKSEVRSTSHDPSHDPSHSLAHDASHEHDVMSYLRSGKTIDDDDFTSMTLSSAKPFLPPITRGKVLKCYDGDTITIGCRFDWSNQVYKFNIRIAGVDCPEIRSTRKDPIEKADEKMVAIIVRDELRKLIMGKIVDIDGLKADKYGGRYVADVCYDDINISRWLLARKFAVPYDGGTKLCPKMWSNYAGVKTDS